VGLIIKTSSDPDIMEREKVYLNKLNMILVQVRCVPWNIQYSCRLLWMEISLLVSNNCASYLVLCYTQKRFWL